MAIGIPEPDEPQTISLAATSQPAPPACVACVAPAVPLAHPSDNDVAVGISEPDEPQTILSKSILSKKKAVTKLESCIDEAWSNVLERARQQQQSLR